MDIALLLFRVLLGVVLLAHSSQKLFGWFGGPGLAGAAQIFASIGQHPAALMVRLAIACELSGAALIVAGVATPLGAAIAAGTMLVAGGALSIAHRKFWNTAGGGEYPFVLAAFASVLGFSGPGRWSLDRLWSVWWYPTSDSRATLVGVLALVVALGSSLVPLLRTSRDCRETQGDSAATGQAEAPAEA